MDALDEIEHYDIYISEPKSDFPSANVFKIIEKIRPNWNIKDIKYEFFNNGLTNKVISFWVDGNDSYERKEDRILFRIYGVKTDVIIDRKNEQLCMNIAFRNNLSPPLYGTFKNGIAYGFVPGKVIDTKSVREGAIARLIARKLAKFHSVDVSHYLKNKVLDFQIPVVFRLIKRFLAAWKVQFDDQFRQNKFAKSFVSKREMELELNVIQKKFESIKSPIVFCHNDLLLNNIIYNNDEINFIDFEYAGLNFQSFDIANHFAEFAGTDDVDYSLYPDGAFRKWWIGEYLEEFNKLNSLPTSQESDIESLDRQVQESLMASHLFWAVWAIAQAHNSQIDFDYLNYGIIRLKEYIRLKNAQRDH